MFGAKYSRLKFWIISVCLLIPDSILITLAKSFERAEQYNTAQTLYIIVFIIALIWVNTLANRMRDHGSNPWFSLFAFIPLVNLILALYYGISKSAIKENIVNNSNNTNPSLAKAVYNHSKDIASEIKPTINEYKANHKTIKNNNTQQKTQISSQTINLNEDEIYEQVLLEIEENKKIKSTWAKAFAQSDGEDKKAESLYINLRVQNIQEEQQRQIEIQKNQEKQAKLAALGGKELNKQEKDFLKKYGVDIFSQNVHISSYSILIDTSSGTKEYIRG